jgi:RNA polymerase sigma factor (sigma-70 family)
LNINNSRENIVLGCCKANRASQREFYTLYFGFAMNICARYCNGTFEAEEITNDGFYKIFNQLKSFVPKSDNYEASLMAWMKTIFINTSIDFFRKNNKHNNNETINDSNYAIANTDEYALDKMSYKEILAILQLLSPAYRAVFNLYVIDGFKHEEIATQLNISVGTSKSNLAKAKQNIQKLMLEKNSTVYEERRAI